MKKVHCIALSKLLTFVIAVIKRDEKVNVHPCMYSLRDHLCLTVDTKGLCARVSELTLCMFFTLGIPAVSFLKFVESVNCSYLHGSNLSHFEA